MDPWGCWFEIGLEASESQVGLEWLDRVMRLCCCDLAWTGGSEQVQRSEPSQGLHRHLLSGWGSPGSYAAGLTRGARRGPQQVERSDTAGGAQVSAGSLLPGAPALPARELSAGVNTRRGVRGVSTERQSRGGAGAPPAKPGRGRGVQISLPWCGLPHRPWSPEPSPRTGGAGAGRRPGGSRPGGGAGRGGRGGAALCKCRPRAANCRRSPRGSERPVPPAAARPERASERTAAVQRALSAAQGQGAPRGAAQPSAAARPQSSKQASTTGPSQAQRPEAERAPSPAPGAGECALGAPARGRPQPTRGEAAPSAPEPSHGPG